ncbi:Uncharacterised protein [Mycobacteroides abscessus subsp. abscessus]|nr:Uncharacterised protein [Mycobacteroides abscessus subsp. abscessus]
MVRIRPTRSPIAVTAPASIHPEPVGTAINTASSPRPPASTHCWTRAFASRALDTGALNVDADAEPETGVSSPAATETAPATASALRRGSQTIAATTAAVGPTSNTTHSMPTGA